MKVGFLTYINERYVENLLLDWLPSARRYHPDADFIALNYGLSKRSIETLQSQNVLVYHTQKVLNSKLYWQDIIDVVTNWDVDVIMKCDSGDLFFQDNVFDDMPLKDQVGIVEEDHPADQGWSLDKVVRLPQPLRMQVLKGLAGCLMCNGGATYGYKQQFLQFAQKIQNTLDNLPIYDYIGLDQVLVNYFGRIEPYVTILPTTYNWVAQCQPYVVGDDGIVRSAKDNHVIKVVHNAGGREIPRIFDGRDIRKPH